MGRPKTEKVRLAQKWSSWTSAAASVSLEAFAHAVVCQLSFDFFAGIHGGKV
jgi:hypothetical protein